MNQKFLPVYRILSAVIVLIIMVAPGCRQPENHQVVLSDTLFINSEDSPEMASGTVENNSDIYYGLYSPADVAGIFERNDLSFDPGILNPSVSASNYTTTSKIALNLGIYGADLSYVKLFNDPRHISGYFNVIIELADKLGIPSDFLQDAATRIDANIDNQDSLNIITSDTFTKIIIFLSQQEREGNAYLIITGGWIEAMYLAMQERVLTNDPEVIRNILEQKYALDYLLSSLKNHYNEPSVAYYYRVLHVLHKYYAMTDISFSKRNFDIDHEAHTIKYAGSSLIYKKENLEKIGNIIASIREIIIEQ